MTVAITILYILNCLFLLMVVLLQAGRGGGMSFTGGAGGGSATVFGNRGAATFLQKLTVASATMFMVLSMLLAYLSSTSSGVEEGVFADPDAVEEISAEDGAAPNPVAAPAATTDGSGE